MMRSLIFASLAAAALALGLGGAPVTEAPLTVVGEVQFTAGDSEVVPIDDLSSVASGDGGKLYKTLPDAVLRGEAVLISSVAEDETVTLVCPDAESLCIFYVALMRCTSCSLEFNGGLPAKLLDNGFESGSCGPMYYTGGASYPTTIFRKVLEGSESIALELTKELKHAAVFYMAVRSTCDSTNEVVCAGKEGCEWDESTGACGLTTLCGVQPQGPFLGQGGCECPA